MDDTYKINAARTEMREAYLSGDADRLLSVFHPDGFTDMSEGSPSRYGGDARLNLAEEATKLFASYSVRFVPIIIEISVMGAVAFDRGWHEFILAPKAGGKRFASATGTSIRGKRCRMGTGRSACTSTIRTFPKRSEGCKVRGS